MSTINEVLSAAMALPSHDRATIADRLFESLDEADVQSDLHPEWETRIVDVVSAPERFVRIKARGVRLELRQANLTPWWWRWRITNGGQITGVAEYRTENHMSMIERIRHVENAFAGRRFVFSSGSPFLRSGYAAEEPDLCHRAH